LAGIVSRSGGALADISDKVHCTIRGDDAAHDTFTCSASSQWHAGDAIVFGTHYTGPGCKAHPTPRANCYVQLSATPHDFDACTAAENKDLDNDGPHPCVALLL